MKKLNIILTSFVLGLGVTVLFVGHGCSGFKGESVLTVNGSGLVEQAYEIIPETKTTSLVYGNQALDNFVSCIGISQPSERVKKEFADRKGSLSEYGDLTEVTSPMFMGLTSLAGEICQDLVNKESVLRAHNRRIFNSIDFNSGGSQFSGASLDDVVRRISRSCWGRNETQEEMDIIIDATQTAISGTANISSPDSSRDMALMVCTGMLASLQTVEM